MSRCTLEVSAHEVVVANGGTLDVEYALFEPGDIQLHSTDPGTNREAAYRTTAGKARERLIDLGVTPALADEAAEATRPSVARAYARGEAVRCVADRLGPSELFEGETFDPSSRLYSGAWLDLPDLAADLGLTGAPSLLQALHLAALLADQAGDQPVVLRTAGITALRRPGERTFRRVVLERPERIVQALRELGSAGRRKAATVGPSRPEVVERLRARAARTPTLGTLLGTLEAAVAVRPQPSQGPLADAEIWALDAKLSLGGDLRGIREELEGLERRRGRLPGTAYLRARAELLLATQEPRDLAERISALSTSMPAFHELELLAARAWAVAGDPRQAKAFARDLQENATASDALRLQALQVLEELDGKGNSFPSAGGGVSRVSLPTIPEAPRSPSNLGVDPTAQEQRPTAWVGPTPASATSSRQPVAPPAAAALVWSNRPTESASERTSSPMAAARSAAPELERLEALSAPAGSQGMPAPVPDEAPRTPATARLAFTVLSRELGRELRMRHGVEPRTDTDGLETTQRYLREKLSDGHVRTREDERELLRHGAFLSELLARQLGAYWIDLESNDSTRWCMLIPADSGAPREPIRAWPFARVLRFVGMGHKERDLVSYYLELESRARHS